ncbi:MAG: RluA family pseudouridine synthase, partial [Planctomycetaceae bacterium]|nr:RluA family pseudouridine synthase [Planctomycetaceae bacterium]
KGETILRPGQRLIRLEPDTVEPDVNPQIRLITWNDGYAVFEKPAPLPMHPCGRFHLNTMTSLLDEAFPEVKFRPAHRLDANTTGVVVFSIHRDLSRKIQRQFEKQQAQKRYLCRVIGQPAEENFTCDLPLSSQPDEQGLRGVDETDGLAASTEFRVLHRFEDGTSLVEAIPKTGRTNQIRVHLWALGFPIQGDPVYLPHQQRQTAQTLSVADPPMCLHAQELKFFCPHTGEEVTFTATRPDWAAF